MLYIYTRGFVCQRKLPNFFENQQQIFIEVWYLHDDTERLRELRPQYLELPDDLVLLQDLRLCNDLLSLREQLEAFWGEISTRQPTLISSLQRENTLAERWSWAVTWWNSELYYFILWRQTWKEDDNQLACLLGFWWIIQSKHSLTFCCSRWKAWQESHPPCKTCTGNGSWSQSFRSRRRCRWSSASLVSPGVCSGSFCPRWRSPGKWRSCWTAAKTCRSPSRSWADLHSGQLNGETPSCLLLQVRFWDETTTSAKRQTDSSFKPSLHRQSRPATCSEA